MAPRGYDRVMIEHDIGRNRKLRRHFKPDERWAYVAGVICIAGAAPIRGTFAVGNEPADERDVAEMADVKPAVARKTIDKLRELGMLVADAELGCDWLYGFDERNPAPKKDVTGAERQRRFRETHGKQEPDDTGVTDPQTVTGATSNGVTDRYVTPSSRSRNVPEVEVEGEEKRTTPPSPPRGGRARDKDIWRKELSAWLAEHPVTDELLATWTPLQERIAEQLASSPGLSIAFAELHPHRLGAEPVLGGPKGPVGLIGQPAQRVIDEVLGAECRLVECQCELSREAAA